MEPLDGAMPIDILFYGSRTAHRDGIREAFYRLGEEHGLRVEFYVQDELYGEERDEIIDRSKVQNKVYNNMRIRQSYNYCIDSTQSKYDPSK